MVTEASIIASEAATKEPTLVVVAVVQTTDQKARDQLIDLFKDVIDYSQDNEPDVLKYAVCIPVHDPKDTKPQDVTTVYAIEEYANQDAFDIHMQSDPVKALIASTVSTSSTPSLLAKPPMINTLRWTSAVFTRTEELRAHPNPFILWATIDTHTVADTELIAPYGAAVVDYASKSEPNTLFYGDARAKDKKDDDAGFIAAVEIYTDKAALDHHFQGQALQAMVAESTKLGGNLTFVGLSKVAGWLVR